MSVARKAIYTLADIFILRVMDIEAIFRALADGTRLRIMRLLGSMELSVGEVAQVLGQSQPRVSRHVGILSAAGLVERRKEGSWVFLRARHGGDASDAVGGRIEELLEACEGEDRDFGAACEQDRRQLAQIRTAREKEAASYFADHAEDWDEVRRLHSSDEQVEHALAAALEASQFQCPLFIVTSGGGVTTWRLQPSSPFAWWNQVRVVAPFWPRRSPSDVGSRTPCHSTWAARQRKEL